MKRVLAGLFVAFSLMFAPLVHASGAGCAPDGAVYADPASHQKNQNDGPFQGAGESHCHHLIADRALVKTAQAPAEALKAFTPSNQHDPVSVTVGPLLEPPSRS